MKNKKGLLAVLLAAVMVMLSGCGKFDTGKYVQACLDAQFKGEYKEYMKLTKSKEDEAKKIYEDGLDELMEEYDSLGISDDMQDDLREAYADMLGKAKYSIKETKESGDTVVVTVAVEPMKCFETYEEDLTALQEEYLKDLQEKVTAGEFPSEEEIVEGMAQLIRDDMVERVKNIEYDKETTVDVTVTKSKNVYTANEDDLAKVGRTALGL